MSLFSFFPAFQASRGKNGGGGELGVRIWTLELWVTGRRMAVVVVAGAEWGEEIDGK